MIHSMLTRLCRTIAIPLICLSCAGKPMESKEANKGPQIRLITIDPGHFHAALVQKSMYPQIDSTVHVYAPGGNDLTLHLDRINAFNTREDNPTSWNEVVYTGEDFLQKMISDKKGNVVVIAGNNRDKGNYINTAVSNGFHVLADKPMAINTRDFELLTSSFETARKNGVLLYDIMTERYEITSILQRRLSHLDKIFGSLEQGSPDNPAVTKESVHHFFKYVSGSPLTRPAWFFDVTQEGEGIVDVTTHLVDLIQWACFPEQVLDYNRDVEMISARRWPTALSADQFREVTKEETFPDYLRKDLKDGVLNVYSNGEINYKLKGIQARVSVIWDYKAPEGAGDSHYSVMRGTRANLVIRQNKDTGFKPALFIEPVGDDAGYDSELRDAFETITPEYPGISLRKVQRGYEVVIPESYQTGHEAHFAEVTSKYLEYLEKNEMPEWEVPNMITKYYITTKALEMARDSSF